MEQNFKIIAKFKINLGPFWSYYAFIAQMGIPHTPHLIFGKITSQKWQLLDLYGPQKVLFYLFPYMSDSTSLNAYSFNKKYKVLDLIISYGR